MDYLLLHCEVTSAIWNIFFNQLGLFWVMLRRVVVCLLVDCWQHLECCCVEDGAFTSFVVSVKRNE
jgi:hypothetical protein